MGVPVSSLKEYDASRPAGEKKLIFEQAIVRAYVKDGQLHIIVNQLDAEGHECLPLGYMLGSSALSYKLRK